MIFRKKKKKVDSSFSGKALFIYFCILIYLFSSIYLFFQIFKEAEKCLTCLSNRLGDKDFFFGSHPSTLDSFVFGCLAPLLKAPFTANVLQNHLKACPNLVKFVNRILQRYFSRELKGIYIQRLTVH